MPLPDSSSPLSPLTALTAVDGRYRKQTAPLAPYFSEGAVIRRRLRVEIDWLRAVLPHLRPALLDAAADKALAEIESLLPDEQTPEAVKVLEAKTNHDVKAAEYWLAERLKERNMAALCPYVHFACTSWDINNVVFSLQTGEAVREVMLPQLNLLVEKLRQLAAEFAAVPMLGRTHGQPASPTTMGKEFANFTARLSPRMARLESFQLPAKMNGAVGNYNAHVVAAPHIDWPALTRDFVCARGLRFSPHTTQIEPYDDLADLFDLLRRINTIILDCCRDCWGYIAIDYLVQTTAADEVGSSTMPHKVNPIDFENAEGNIGIANALLSHFVDKLPVSRWQRDLSDSTVLRAVGGAFGHTLIAWRATLAGLNKITVNPDKLRADLDDNWQVLGEAVQTVMRAEGIADAYEQMKTLSRGKRVGMEEMRAFIAELPIGDEAKRRLTALTPANYCGLAESLALMGSEKKGEGK